MLIDIDLIPGLLSECGIMPGLTENLASLSHSLGGLANNDIDPIILVSSIMLLLF